MRESADVDTVGRFRSGYQIGGRTVALQKWRVTTSDSDVAKAIQSCLGGSEPQHWETQREDNLEVFTATSVLDIVLQGPTPLRQRLVLSERRGEPLRREGVGSVPDIDLFFRLANEPALGTFLFKTGSWSFVSDLAYNDTESQLENLFSDSDSKGVRAMLKLEEVTFTAKNGPRAGQVVNYTKPSLTLLAD